MTLVNHLYGRRQNCVNREAVQDCSPRRKPWGSAKVPAQPRRGAKERHIQSDSAVSGKDRRAEFLLSPLRGFFPSSSRYPTACAVGCNLAPLRGWRSHGLRMIQTN